MTHALTLMLLIFPCGRASRGDEAARAATPSSTAAALADRLVFVQIPVDPEAGRTGPDARLSPNGEIPPGSRIVAFDPSTPGDGVVNLTPGFFAAGCPDVSCDGRRILFVGRRAMDAPFHVWEMNTDGGGLRRVMGPPGPRGPAAPVAGRSAVYLSTIYTIDADAPGEQIAFSTNEDGGALYTCRLDGTRVRRITFNPEGVSDPLLLSDGRLLISSSLPSAAGESAAPQRVGPAFQPVGSALVTINTDGTDLFPFAGLHEPAAIRAMPCETPDEWVVYVESAPGGDGGGSLVAVARTRSLHTRRVVAEDPKGLYRSPWAPVEGMLLVSFRRVAGGSYGLHLLDMHSGTRIAEVFDDPQWHEVDALSRSPRARPKGRSSVVDDRVQTGWLYCLNAYLSDRPEGERIQPGQIQRVRVIRAVMNEDDPSNSSSLGSAWGTGFPACLLTDWKVGPTHNRVTEEVLDEIVVESDGSFLVEVPARTPLRLEALDAQGEVLQRMRSWIWVMPKEARGCIGCHEDRELTPPNRPCRALWKVGRRTEATWQKAKGKTAKSR